VSLVSPVDVLLLSGLPGAGKSHFAKWLEGCGWGRLESDDADPRVREVLGAAVGGSDEPLLSERRKYPLGLVLEWGFPMDWLPQLRAMIGRGYNAWYFDGDREAALQGWTNAHQGWDVGLWHQQVQRLDARWPEICPLYRSKILTTVGPGPWHLPEQEIHRLMGLESVSSTN
jgi:hypothetical protein